MKQGLLPSPLVLSLGPSILVSSGRHEHCRLNTQSRASSWDCTQTIILQSSLPKVRQIWQSTVYSRDPLQLPCDQTH